MSGSMEVHAELLAGVDLCTVKNSRSIQKYSQNFRNLLVIHKCLEKGCDS